MTLSRHSSLLAGLLGAALLLVPTSADARALQQDAKPATNVFEGDEPGECADGADNDRDGRFDCADPDCFAAPDCRPEGDEAAEEDEQAPEPETAADTETAAQPAADVVDDWDSEDGFEDDSTTANKADPPAAAPEREPYTAPRPRPRAPVITPPTGPELKFEMDGYYRIRGHLFGNLFDREFPKDGARDVALYYLEDPATDIPVDFIDDFQASNPNSTTGQLVDRYCRNYPAQCRQAVHNPHRSSWFVQRGRFEPTLTMRGIKVAATIDVFDNVVWGDNENLAATPLFAGDPSDTQTNGTVTDSIRVKRLWAEWRTAFGLLRVGRQPSHWGLGILANDGNGFRNDFGDAYQGNTFDRIIFATRPVSLVKGIHAIATGKPTPDPADDPGIIVAVGFDKLVESSAITFRKQISDDDNISDENAEGSAGIRQSPVWLSDQGDDVLEMIYVLMFKREDWQVGSQVMDLTVGTYWINRWQTSTNSNVWIPDIYIRWAMRGFFFEGELYHIFGETDAIAPDFDKTTDAEITGFVARGGYQNPYITGLFEVGHASGDDSILDDHFTGRPLHADFNVGLILYEQLMAQRTIEKFVGDEDTQGLWSQGGVYNSTYINPRFKWRPGDIWEFRLGFLMAWADEVDGAIIPYLDRDDGSSESSGQISESKLLGTEIDLGIHMKWLDEHILIAIEGGYMHAGPRMGRMTQYQNPDEAVAPLAYNSEQYQQITKRLNNVFTVQARFAFVF